MWRSVRDKVGEDLRKERWSVRRCKQEKEGKCGAEGWKESKEKKEWNCLEFLGWVCEMISDPCNDGADESCYLSLFYAFLFTVL